MNVPLICCRLYTPAPELYTAETLGTAMRLKPITATARRQGHRRKYLPTARPEGEADQYFRTGPTGGRPEQDGRSLPLSPRLRLTLRRVVSEATALPRPPSSLVERRRTRAGRAASSPGGASSGGAWPRMGITDPRGDIAGDPAVGYGRFRFHPNIIPRIIISASANSVRTAPQGAARKTSVPAGSNQPGRDVDR